MTNMAWRSWWLTVTLLAVDTSPPAVMRESETATIPSRTFIATQNVIPPSSRECSCLCVGSCRRDLQLGQPHRWGHRLRGHEGVEDRLAHVVQLPLQGVEELVQAPGDDLLDAGVGQPGGHP